MYAMTSYPFVRRTFATLRSAEFGFFGVRVITCTQTPRRNGQLVSAGDFDFTEIFLRPLRTSWLIVGIRKLGFVFRSTSPPFPATKNPPLPLEERALRRRGARTLEVSQCAAS